MPSIGTVQQIDLTFGGFGNQWTTIDGVRYATWFDFKDGIKVGALVEYERYTAHMGNFQMGAARVKLARRPLANVRVEELRKQYLGGRRSTGSAVVDDMGLTYCAKPIAWIEFARNKLVRYYDAADKVIGVFQDVAALDD